MWNRHGLPRSCGSCRLMITTSALPAAASSLIPPVLTQRRDAAPLGLDECPGPLERLAVVPDPRDRRGRRHPLVSVLALAAAAVLAGARSLTAIGEWAAGDPASSPLVGRPHLQRDRGGHHRLVYHAKRRRG